MQSQLSPTGGSSIYCDKPSLDKICQVQLHCLALGAHVSPTDCKHRHTKGESQHRALLDPPGSLPEHICMKCSSLEDPDSHGVKLLPSPLCTFSRPWGDSSSPNIEWILHFRRAHPPTHARHLLCSTSVLQQGSEIKPFLKSSI